MPDDSLTKTREGPAPRKGDAAAAPLDPAWHYHLLGIGGIGMSAVAEILHRRGFRISGSDTVESEAFARLASLGIAVTVGHDPAVLAGANAVVYTPAVREEHPIWREVERRNLPRFHRTEVLAALLAGVKTLAVAGTHGKTTTTACLALALHQAGLAPTAMIGGHVPQLGGANTLLGSGDWAVVEADESDGSFVKLAPHGILLTNVDADHLDFHGSLENLREAFAGFLARLPADGLLVYCRDDLEATALAGRFACRKISYGCAPEAEVRVAVTGRKPGATSLRLTTSDGDRALTVRLPGLHNAVNLAGVYAMGRAVGLSGESLCKSLAEFRGVSRRQEFLGEVGGVRIFDDYAHHPAEIRATLTAFRELYPEPITVVFQPHLYSRTALFAKEMAEALRPATRIFLAEIYGAREAPIEGVTSGLILNALAGHPGAFPIAHWREMAERVAAGDVPPGILITMGAGDIAGLGPLLLGRGAAQ